MQVIYPEKFQKRYEEAKEYWNQVFESDINELNRQQKEVCRLKKHRKFLWKIFIISTVITLLSWGICLIYSIINRLNMGNGKTVRDITIDSSINILPVIITISLILSLVMIIMFIIWFVSAIRERTDRTIYEYYIDFTLERCANHIMKPYKFYIGTGNRYGELFRLHSYFESMYQCLIEMQKHNIKNIKSEQKKDECLIKSLDEEHPFSFVIKDWDKYTTKYFIKDGVCDFRFLDNIGLKQR